MRYFSLTFKTRATCPTHGNPRFKDNCPFKDSQKANSDDRGESKHSHPTRLPNFPRLQRQPRVSSYAKGCKWSLLGHFFAPTTSEPVQESTEVPAAGTLKARRKRGSTPAREKEKEKKKVSKPPGALPTPTPPSAGFTLFLRSSEALYRVRASFLRARDPRVAAVRPAGLGCDATRGGPGQAARRLGGALRALHSPKPARQLQRGGRRGAGAGAGDPVEFEVLGVWEREEAPLVPPPSPSPGLHLLRRPPDIHTLGGWTCTASTGAGRARTQVAALT